ncbi:MAG: ATP-binding protein, partial [Desulfobacterales bacterium]
IEFRVEDEGPGIADEIKPRIFEPFFSTHKTSYNTGLGLSVVHGIVREHDGVIDVYDTSNGGAGFRIVLPKNASAKQEEKNK